jgi:SAM-dependent methyltransferase
MPQTTYTFTQFARNRSSMEEENTLPPSNQNLFDHYAPRYHAVLNRALSPSGEPPQYFARSRIQWLHNRLQAIGFAPSTVLDYGCGTGGSVPFLREILGPSRILGVDISPESLLQARRDHGGEGIEFANLRHSSPHSEFHLAFCNGVFHHIAPAQRPTTLRYIHDSLIPGGVFAFWENNPWNPATRYVMGRCEFDVEAMPIRLAETKKLLCSNGFQILCSGSYFYFPRWLKWLRWLESALSHLPLGAQYMVLARKPG